jgi:hypothetical protein
MMLDLLALTCVGDGDEFFCEVRRVLAVFEHHFEYAALDRHVGCALAAAPYHEAP